MENAKENKAKFFAQYFGQEVWRCELHNQLMEVDYEILAHVDESIMGAPIIKEWLELKPLSQITDEDAIEVSKIWGSEVDSKILGNILAIRIGTRAESEVRNSIGIIDFIRSKSYALPYMNLSVEQLIEYKWIKLTK